MESHDPLIPFPIKFPTIWHHMYVCETNNGKMAYFSQGKLCVVSYIVCGFLLYVWEPTIGKCLLCERELQNSHVPMQTPYVDLFDLYMRE